MTRKIGLIALGLALGAFEIWAGWSVLPRNYLGAGLIFIGLGYCIGGGFFLALGRRDPDVLRSDRSLAGLAPGALLVLLAMPLEFLFLPAALPRGYEMQSAGLLLILLGMLVRLWARAALRADYQGNLQARPGQRLVTGGPYRWIRHPGYAAFLLMALGLAVGFSSIAGLLGTTAFFIGLRYRIQVEEELLGRTFGEEYAAYAGRTRRLIPGIW